MLPFAVQSNPADSPSLTDRQPLRILRSVQERAIRPDCYEDKTMPKYNGHKNWNHWNVSLWINNDEGLHRLARYCVDRTDTKGNAARCFLRLVRADKTPDGAKYSFSSVRAAMRGM